MQQYNVTIAITITTIILLILLFCRSQSQGRALIWYYSPDCGACKRYTPEWKIFVKRYPRLRTEMIDTSTPSGADASKEIKFVPTLVKVYPCGFRCTYKGDFNADTIAKWA